MRFAIEVLDRDPEIEVILVPICEQIVEEPDPASGHAFTLAQALFLYAHGQEGPLTELLERDERSCNCLAGFNEEWFVRAEASSNSWCEAESRNARDAVAIARVVANRRAAQRALADL